MHAAYPVIQNLKSINEQLLFASASDFVEQSSQVWPAQPFGRQEEMRLGRIGHQSRASLLLRQHAVLGNGSLVHMASAFGYKNELGPAFFKQPPLFARPMLNGD